MAAFIDANFVQIVKSIPQRHEGETQEEAKYSSKFGHLQIMDEKTSNPLFVLIILAARVSGMIGGVYLIHKQTPSFLPSHMFRTAVTAMV